MEMRFKIIERHPEQNMIVVRYYTDTVSELELAVQLDAEGKVLRASTDRALTLAIPAPRDQELERFVFSAAPWQHFEFGEKLRTLGQDTDHILPLMNVEHRIDAEQHKADVKVARILAEDAAREATEPMRLPIFRRRNADFFGVKVVES